MAAECFLFSAGPKPPNDAKLPKFLDVLFIARGRISASSYLEQKSAFLNLKSEEGNAYATFSKMKEFTSAGFPNKLAKSAAKSRVKVFETFCCGILVKILQIGILRAIKCKGHQNKWKIEKNHSYIYEKI
uniref:Uncharacterized protein n=1 Tax=Romanomermis culicivorax TaxID=13658 RepID=A0A915K7K4_ROMCU